MSLSPEVTSRISAPTGTKKVLFWWRNHARCQSGEVSRRARGPAGVCLPLFYNPFRTGGKVYEAVKAAARGRTLEVVPHCRPSEDADFPGRDVANSSLKLTDVWKDSCFSPPLKADVTAFWGIRLGRLTGNTFGRSELSSLTLWLFLKHLFLCISPPSRAIPFKCLNICWKKKKKPI